MADKPGGETVDDWVDAFLAGRITLDDIPRHILSTPLTGYRNLFNDPSANLSTIGQFVTQVQQIRNTPGLSAEDIDLFVRQAREDPPAVGDFAELAAEAGRLAMGREDAQTARATAATNLESGLSALFGPIVGAGEFGPQPTSGPREGGGLKDVGLEFFDTQIDRLQGFLDDPNSLRSDAEMSGILSSFENAINAQLETTRKGAAKTLASSGLRAAGKVSNPVRAAGQQAAFQKGQGIQNLLGQAQQRLDPLRQGRLGFLGDIGAAEADIRQGGLGNTLQLGAFTQGLQLPDFASPFAAGVDFRGLGLGQRASEVGFFADIFTGIGDQLLSGGQAGLGAVTGN